LKRRRAGREPAAGRLSVRIIDLSEGQVATYCKCLEDWSHEFDDEGGRKRAWYEREKELGLRVKLAEGEGGRIVGMIQYAPIERAPVIGRGLYYIYCVWVHGYKEGVGDNQGQGIGRALLAAAEEDARSLGATGMAAWGLRIPVFMRSKWFKRQGYRHADSEGMTELVMKAFSPEAERPRFLGKKPQVQAGKARVRVTAAASGWCPAQNLVYERARRAAEHFGDKVEFVGIGAFDKDSFLETGLSDALFIDGKAVRTGPPPSYEAIERLVERRLRKRGLLQGEGI
jgi:GNAT superfamily N-acetyltransferase